MNNETFCAPIDSSIIKISQTNQNIHVSRNNCRLLLTFMHFYLAGISKINFILEFLT